MMIVDAHCDTILQLAAGRSLAGNPHGQLDIPRMEQGDIGLQFFAVFVEDEFLPGKGLARTAVCIEAFYRAMDECDGFIYPILTKEDLARIGQGQIGALLTLEGGEPLHGELEILDCLYRLGIRSMGLTWNRRNELGDGSGEAITGGGLTRFGRKVVKRMQEKGMLVDVAHLSEAGFWDVMDITTKPVIASHANCSVICEHVRNLDDQQIKTLAETGGVVGITFVPDFLGKEASIETIVNHVDHVCGLLGRPDHVGFGSDFDGTTEVALGIEHAGKYRLLVESLRNRGYKETDIAKITSGNFLRVLFEVL